MDEFEKVSSFNANLALEMKNNTALLCDESPLKSMTYSAFLDSVEIQYLKMSSTSKFSLCDIYKSLCYGNVIDEKIMHGYAVTNKMMNYKILFDSVFTTYCESNPENYEVVLDSPLLDNILYEIDPIHEIAMNKLLKLYNFCPIKQNYLKQECVLLIHINLYEEALSIFGSPFQGTPYISDWPPEFYGIPKPIL